MSLKSNLMRSTCMAAVALTAMPLTSHAEEEAEIAAGQQQTPSGPQAQQASSNVAQPFTTDVIVVTARLREENLQETPLSITALGGDMLQDRGVTDVRALMDQVPGVYFTNQGGPGLGNVSMRGLTQGSLIGDEANVASFVDGFYWSGRIAFDGFIDGLERVEVVRGPQSALYGRNSFSGAINYITKKPNMTEMEGGGRMSFGGHGHGVGAINLSMPVVEDKLAFRIDASHLETGGSNINPVNQERLNNANSENIRAQIALQASDQISFNYSFTYVDRKTTDQPLYAVPFGELDGGYKMDFISFSYRNHKTEFPTMRPSDDLDRHVSDLIGSTYKVKRHTFRIDYEAEAFTTSVLIAQTDEDIRAISDATYGLGGDVMLASLMDFTTFPAPTFLPPQPVDLDGNFIPDMFPVVGGQPIQDRSDFSAEIRFQSNSDGPFHWAFGGFFSRLKYNDRLETGYDISEADMAAVAAWTPNPFQFANIGTIPATYTCNPMDFASCPMPIMTDTWGVAADGTIPLLQEKFFENEEASIFASLSFDVDEKTSITVEGRQTWESRYMEDIVERTRLYNNNFATPISKKYNSFTPRVIVDHQLNDSTFLYAIAAKGAKAGGVQPSQSAGRTFYDPETNWTYEGGVKFSLLDGHLNLNFSAFYVDWKNMQLRENVGLDNIVTNLGEAEVKGLEILGAWKVHQNVQFRFGYTFQDGKITQGSTASAAGYCDMPQLPHELVEISSFGNPAAWNPAVQAACGFVPDLSFATPGSISLTSGDISGNRMSNAPRHTAVFGLDVDIPISDDVSFIANMDYNYRSQTFLDFENFVSVGSTNLVNASIGIARGDDWKFSLWVRNLTDEDGVVSAIRNFNILGQTLHAVQHREARMFGMTASASF